jgi:hypothetical protein
MGVTMARFTMQDLERLSVGQGTGIDTSRYPEGSDTSQHLVWMQPTIYARIWDAVQQGGAMTRLEIARALGVKKSPWLVQAIERLAADDYLVKIESRTPQGVVMWMYEVRK